MSDNEEVKVEDEEVQKEEEEEMEKKEDEEVVEDEIVPVQVKETTADKVPSSGTPEANEESLRDYPQNAVVQPLLTGNNYYNIKEF